MPCGLQWQIRTAIGHHWIVGACFIGSRQGTAAGHGQHMPIGRSAFGDQQVVITVFLYKWGLLDQPPAARPNTFAAGLVLQKPNRSSADRSPYGCLSNRSAHRHLRKLLGRSQGCPAKSGQTIHQRCHPSKSENCLLLLRLRQHWCKRGKSGPDETQGWGIQTKSIGVFVGSCNCSCRESP